MRTYRRQRELRKAEIATSTKLERSLATPPRVLHEQATALRPANRIGEVAV